MNDTRCAIDINQLISTSLQLIANSCCSLNNWFIPKCGSITMQVRADQRKILETKEEHIEALEARNEALERTNADFLQRPEGFRCVMVFFMVGWSPYLPPQNGLSLATMGRSLADEADGSIDSLIRGFKISKQLFARTGICNDLKIKSSPIHGSLGRVTSHFKTYENDTFRIWGMMRNAINSCSLLSKLKSSSKRDKPSNHQDPTRLGQDSDSGHPQPVEGRGICLQSC